MNTTSPQEPVTAERRVAPRFQPAFETVYRFQPLDREDGRVGLVWNISRTGISMLLADPPTRGGTVGGELACESSAVAVSIGLRIVHVRSLSTGDYLLGAQFSRPLDAEEMRSFLTPPPRERLESASEATLPTT